MLFSLLVCVSSFYFLPSLSLLFLFSFLILSGIALSWASAVCEETGLSACVHRLDVRGGAQVSLSKCTRVSVSVCIYSSTGDPFSLRLLSPFLPPLARPLLQSFLRVARVERARFWRHGDAEVI